MASKSYKVKTYVPCDSCGQLTNRRRRNTRLAVCLACGINRHNSQIIQMHEKSGPYWDEWLVVTIAALQGRGGGGVG